LRTDLTPEDIKDIEQGHRDVSLLTLVRIAQALDVALADLLEDDVPV
jgi:transcriptional regulator with XRE-family HTH domain